MPANIQLYIAGWCCKSTSFRNTNRKPVSVGLEHFMEEDATISTRTLNGGLQTIVWNQPYCAILENPKGTDFPAILRFCAVDLNGNYEPIVIELNGWDPPLSPPN